MAPLQTRLQQGDAMKFPLDKQYSIVYGDPDWLLKESLQLFYGTMPDCVSCRHWLPACANGREFTQGVCSRITAITEPGFWCKLFSQREYEPEISGR